MANNFSTKTITQTLKPILKEQTIQAYEKEVASIERLIKKTVSSQKETFISPSLIKRIRICLQVLKEANKISTKKREVRQVQQGNSYEQILKEYEELKQTFQEMYDIKTVKAALIEGQIIVTKFREQITGEKILYKILAIGENAQEIVVYESAPSIAELYAQSSLDLSGGALKMTVAQEQFKKLITKCEEYEQELQLANSVLNKMNKAQLEKLDAANLLIPLANAINEDLGSKIFNMGHIGEAIESLQQYSLSEAENIYSLLEKSKNVLPYYLGPDTTTIVDGTQLLYQIKTLSFFGTTGRFDIATFTNVISPLEEILTILSSVDKNEVKKHALESFFTAKVNSGEIKLKKSEAIKTIIAKQVENKIF